MSRFLQKLSKKIFLRKKIRFNGSPEKIFTRFYKYNYWGSKESRSGFGSSFSSTENIRRNLPSLFKDYGIKKVLDAPCGDFNWMRHVVPISGIQYIGGDIVESLVCLNQRKYSKKGGGGYLLSTLILRRFSYLMQTYCLQETAYFFFHTKKYTAS